MTLSGATIISQAVGLQYPIGAVLQSIAPICSEIVVNVDAAFQDGTEELVKRALADSGCLHTKIIAPRWNWSAHDAGGELARQTNTIFAECTGDWILYVQADEAVHEEDHADIRWMVDTLPSKYVGIEMLRLYFYRNLDTLRTDWTLPLVRLFRRGQGRSVGDAMNCVVDGAVWPLNEGHPALWHYSRTGDPKIIDRRIWSCDRLFHRSEDLRPPERYDFAPRQFDTHAMTEQPPAVEGVLRKFGGIHPRPMIQWFATNREPLPTMGEQIV